MNTVIYLIRHSKTEKVNHVLNGDSLLVQNEKSILSMEGEMLAYNHSKKDIFNDLDCVISSNYVRAMSTAKYFLNDKCNCLQIIEDFGERKHGVSSYSELPKDFEINQFMDEDYKVGSGESQKEVRNRMYSGLIRVLNEKYGQRILIVSHSTAICFLLMKWCDVEFGKSIKFNGNVIMDGDWHYCQTFKLVFDKDNNLIEISNILV
ncbi:MAG: histidine phosphatase family protein [Firmicutes bacterium]|nr:histidine phosphatase family protein [Bacillota bacterium]